jgi:uncharacterized membrane protein YqjE
MQEESAREQDRATAPDTPAPSSSLLDELNRLARAVRHLFGAQLHLLAAELGLARSAVSWMLAAALVATVAAVALGLTLLGLVGALLAQWFHSWILALLVLALLQALLLAGAILLFRRCMHWMSLPATRHEWSAMMRETVQRAERDNGDGGEGKR